MNKRAFTLIEMLVTIAIIGILTAAVTASYGRVKQKSRDTRRKTDLLNIGVALESYYAFNRIYPADGTGCYQGSGNTYDDTVYISHCPPANQDPWIPNLTPYLNPLPKDPGSQSADDFEIAAIPCKLNGSGNPTSGNSYMYRVDLITNPAHYFLTARLELNNDSDALANNQDCITGNHNVNVSSGFTVDARGFPLYVIYK